MFPFHGLASQVQVEVEIGMDDIGVMYLDA
jgi:hypothetical protein